jgi:hypothetical protein
MKNLDQKESMGSNEMSSHSKGQQQPSHFESAESEARNLNNVMTADNSVVDVFEYEPMGYMSKGRW